MAEIGSDRGHQWPIIGQLPLGGPLTLVLVCCAYGICPGWYLRSRNTDKLKDPWIKEDLLASTGHRPQLQSLANGPGTAATESSGVQSAHKFASTQVCAAPGPAQRGKPPPTRLRRARTPRGRSRPAGLAVRLARADSAASR